MSSGKRIVVYMGENFDFSSVHASPEAFDVIIRCVALVQLYCRIEEFYNEQIGDSNEL